MPGKTRP